MASNDRSLSTRIGRWRILFNNTQEFLADVPHIEGDVRELGAIADEVSILRAERMAQEAKLRETTLKIRKLSKRGDSLRGRIGASLKGRFGFDSLLLIQFGFTPRKKGVDREAKLSPEIEARLAQGPTSSALSSALPGEKEVTREEAPEEGTRGAGEASE
jgi:hypothetical protein